MEGAYQSLNEGCCVYYLPSMPETAERLLEWDAVGDGQPAALDQRTVVRAGAGLENAVRAVRVKTGHNGAAAGSGDAEKALAGVMALFDKPVEIDLQRKAPVFPACKARLIP